jgi:hypothetical protein
MIAQGPLLCKVRKLLPRQRGSGVSINHDGHITRSGQTTELHCGDERLDPNIGTRRGRPHGSVVFPLWGRVSFLESGREVLESL